MQILSVPHFLLPCTCESLSLWKVRRVSVLKTGHLCFISCLLLICYYSLHPLHIFQRLTELLHQPLPHTSFLKSRYCHLEVSGEGRNRCTWSYFKVIFDYLKYQSLHPFLQSLRLISAYFLNICQNKIKLQWFQKDHYISKSTDCLKKLHFFLRQFKCQKKIYSPVGLTFGRCL